jgi:hypothetical protein
MNEDDQTEVPREDRPVPGLDRLSMHAQPSRDLWPGINARIAVRHTRPAGLPFGRNRNAFLAAAACTLIAFSAMLSLRVTQEQASIVPRDFHPVVAPPEFAAMTLPRADLHANRALVKANLRLTQNAESQLRNALRQAPDDPSLQRLLASTRAQKKELHDLLMADRD